MINKKVILLVIFLLGVIALAIIFRGMKKEESKEILRIGSFVEIPQGVDGFSCYIFSDQMAIDNNLYTIVGDPSHAMYMNINDELQEFKAKDYSLDSVTNKEMYTLNNGIHSLLIVMNSETGSTGNLDESFNIQGEYVISKNGSSLRSESKFVGYCNW